MKLLRSSKATLGESMFLLLFTSYLPTQVSLRVVKALSTLAESVSRLRGLQLLSRITTGDFHVLVRHGGTFLPLHFHRYQTGEESSPPRMKASLYSTGCLHPQFLRLDLIRTV